MNGSTQSAVSQRADGDKAPGARAEDHGEPGHGKDRLYQRVYDCSSGTTLMLISSNASNPTNIAPVEISTGNLQIHTSGCD